MELHGFQLVVIWVSMLGSGLSTIFCSWACWRLTAWKFSFLPRIALVIAATFAAVYCASYIWLLNNPHQVAVWSETMRPFGMVNWFIGPWTALPLTLILYGNKMSKRMVNQASDLISEIRGSEEVFRSLELDQETGDDAWQ